MGDEEALSLLHYGLQLRIFGDDPYIGSWRHWDKTVEDFLVRRNYRAHNETLPKEGTEMSAETVHTITDAPKPKHRSHKKTWLKGAAVGLLAGAGVTMLFASKGETEPVAESFVLEDDPTDTND